MDWREVTISLYISLIKLKFSLHKIILSFMNHLTGATLLNPVKYAPESVTPPGDHVCLTVKNRIFDSAADHLLNLYDYFAFT